MRWLIIGIAVLGGIAALFAYACCVVAGRADERTERYTSEMEGEHEETQ